MVVRVPGLVVEVEEVSGPSLPSVNGSHPQYLGDCVSVAEGLQGGVPDVDGVYDRLVPVGVFVTNCGEDLVQVVDVSVSNVRSGRVK